MERPRLVLAILIAGALALSAVLVVDYVGYRRDRDHRSIALGEQAGTRVADALDAQLGAVSERARRYAKKVPDVASEERLLASIREESSRLPLILGVTVAYEPGRFLGKDRYAPFFNKSRDEFQFVEDSYDYTSRELDTARWYTSVVDSGRAGWSAPYFARAAEVMVVDYGVPLLDSAGELIGMVDYTITLSDFTKIVDSLSVGESGYGFTYDRDGVILSHPDPDYLLENVFRLRDGKTESILKKLKEDRQGVVEYYSTYTHELSWFFFRALESTGWKSVIVFTEDDLLGASDRGRKKLVHIAMGIGLLAIAVSAFLLRIDRYDRRRLWWMVVVVSLVVTANIVVVWYLNLTTDFSRLDGDQERIVNESVLNKYVEAYDRDLYRFAGAEYRKVPTGILIESYELTSFEASLIGRLWMKYPKDLIEVAPPAFYFPDVSALESRGLVSEVISRVEADDHVLVTWKFRATLEQGFSYAQYPFEQNDIRVAILYPDFGKHILLVPDLESYDILNPSAKPGLNPSITVPSSETIASFFGFETIDYRTDFGNSAQLDHYPALTFNLVAKRVYLSPFIANIIPILIVALIMFIVLYVSSREADGRAGLTTMNVVQSAAGFLFILLLAHVNERNRIQTPEIAYIELFYFSMYVLVTLQSIGLAMWFNGSEWRVFTYHDNLIPKLLFWPVLLSTWLGVTLLRFY